MSAPLRCGRRALGVAGVAALTGAFFAPRAASAMGRTPLGGTLALSLPWSLAALDPHDDLDAASAFFAPAAFDALFALTAQGTVYPALADAMPARDGGGAIVRLRPGLRTAGGRSLDARDVVASLARARAAGGAALLAALGRVTPAPKDPLAIAFPRADAALVARTLASPLTAIVPRSFDPRAPDGTGAFAARLRGGGMELARNEHAARGAAWLERVSVRPSADLREGLRAFETGGDDLGWLGAGLFGRRSDAVAFDLGAAALMVLMVGDGLGAHARPGGAQALCDGIPRDRVAHLGLGDLPSGEPAARWTGAPVDLCVEGGAPHLREIAAAVAASLSQPDHEVTVRVVPRREALARSRRDALGLFVLRPALPGDDGARVALTQLGDPRRAASLSASVSPGLAGSPRSLTGLLRVGVLGALRVAGGVARQLQLAAQAGGGWDLGASHLRGR